MVRATGDIQDLLTDKSLDDIYIEGANDFEEWTVIEDDDITILENEEALWQVKRKNLAGHSGPDQPF